MSRKNSDVFSEVVVGIFMVAVIALLGYFTILISGVDMVFGRQRAQVTIAFKAGEGLASRLVYDKKLGADAFELLENLNGVSARIVKGSGTLGKPQLHNEVSALSRTCARSWTITATRRSHRPSARSSWAACNSQGPMMMQTRDDLTEIPEYCKKRCIRGASLVRRG